jgi:hypothetical protein
MMLRRSTPGGRAAGAAFGETLSTLLSASTVRERHGVEPGVLARDGPRLRLDGCIMARDAASAAARPGLAASSSSIEKSPASFCAAAGRPVARTSGLAPGDIDERTRRAGVLASCGRHDGERGGLRPTL